MEISKTVLYVGVNDHITDLFEGQYVVPNGMAYNSYLILDQKIAVMDIVKNLKMLLILLQNTNCVLQNFSVCNTLVVKSYRGIKNGKR